MSTPFQQAGAQSKPTKYAPVFTNEWFTGLWTQRNPLRDAATPFVYQKFYSASRYESIIANGSGGGGDSFDCELTQRLTIARRPGLSVYNSNIFPAIDAFYEFSYVNSSGSESIKVIADTNATLYDATAPNQVTILNKNPNAGQAFVQAVGGILFIGDGAEAMKYLQKPANSGTFVTQNWGISLQATASTAGPNGAGLGADVAVTGSSGIWNNPTNIETNSPVSGTFASTSLNPSTSSAHQGPDSPGTASQTSTGRATWNNINNIKKQDGVFSTATLASDGRTTETLKATGYGFSVPSNATVVGISVNIFRFASSNGFGPGFANVSDNLVQLIVGGAGVGTNKAAAGTWPSSNTAKSYGSSSDLWGNAAITPSQVNGSNFGVQLQAIVSASGSWAAVADVDYISVTVFYQITGGLLYSDLLEGSEYSFNIAAGNTISGIQVAVYGSQIGSGGSVTAQLIVNGNLVGTSKNNILLPGSFGHVTLGGTTDLWGAGSVLTPANVNNNNAGKFGVAIQAQNPSQNNISYRINGILITVYSSGALANPTPVAGNLSPTVGYQYGYAYGNSLSGAVSNMSVPTATTGPQTNKSFNINLVASSDPQVDQIWLYRTTDGGTVFFALPSDPYPNTSQTVNDNTPDNQLNTLLQAPFSTSLGGTNPVGSNNPPPADIVKMTYHLGRVWGVRASQPNVLIYSAAALAPVMGNPAEAFPPLNYFVFPNIIGRLFPTVLGLFVFSASDVWLIPNTGSSPYFGQPVPYVPSYGLYSWNAFAYNGSIVYFMTTDNRVVSLDPASGVTEIGFPIGDIFSNFNANTSYLAWHVQGSPDKGLYVSDGQTQWYRLTPSLAPEVGMAWSPQGNPNSSNGGISAIQSVEILPGIHNLLVGPPTAGGPILKRDSSVNTDNGSTFPWQCTIGNLVMAQPGQIAELSFITTDSLGAAPQISVIMDEVSGNFESLLSQVQDPPQLVAPSSMFSQRYYFSAGLVPAWCRHLQIQFAFPAENIYEEMLCFGLYGAVHNCN